MSSLYESMNKYFEDSYGIGLDNTKKLEKKSLNESKQKLGARKAMQEGIKSRKAMKEARGRTSGKFTVQKALLDAHLDLPRDLSPESQKTAVKKALDVLKAARAAAETDAEKKQYDNAINILTNRPTPVAFNSLGAWYSGISMSEQMGRSKKNINEDWNTEEAQKFADSIIGSKVILKNYDYEEEDDPENVEFIKSFEGKVGTIAACAILDGYDGHETPEQAKESFNSMYWDVKYGNDEVLHAISGTALRFINPLTGKQLEEKFNRRKVESLKSAPKRHGLKESKRIVSRRAMKESLGTDIEKYQKYVDYDMKHYGKISNKTQAFIDKAGLQVVKDQYGDYEVTAGRYKEGCSPRNKMKLGAKKRSEITEAKGKKEQGTKEKKQDTRDIWEIIYGELTEDGAQYIVPETGKPRINKGAGYKFDTQIGVDVDGNIVVKAATEEELEPAKAIAERHGVEAVPSVDKYDTTYPHHLTIKIDLDESLKESVLTEKHWNYSVNDRVAKEFHDAVRSDDEDFERVRRAIVAVYDDIHENAPELLDDDDYYDWVTEEAEVIDLDDEDDVNWLLTQLYDFCDNAGIWLGL